MRVKFLKYLFCPQCQVGLDLKIIKEVENGAVESGVLTCLQCHREYPIVRAIPRFVPENNYAQNFGLQWNKYSSTQYDQASKTNLSEKRFFEETKWERKLEGQQILEVGCGSGRFTEHALSTGATVISLDYSNAIDANHSINGRNPNLLLVQGNIYSMPFKKNSFENVFCFGVLQHTPDVKKSFMQLVSFLMSNGRLATDVYRMSFIGVCLFSKYWLRPITKRMNYDLLFKMTDKYIDFIWPLTRFIKKIPFGSLINRQLLVPDFHHSGWDENVLKEWVKLNMFDMLSPMYDNPQTYKTFRNWFVEAGLINIDVHRGYNGYEGRAVKP